MSILYADHSSSYLIYRMGKPKNTKEEVKEKRRLAARQRRERIKNDPVLYQQSKEKEKERYNKRKRDKKIVPICEMSPKNRKKTQKRNRENFRAYYKRQKEKGKLETIEEEVIVDIDVLDNNITDPLETLSTPLHLNDLSYSLRSKNFTKRVSLQLVVLVMVMRDIVNSIALIIIICVQIINVCYYHFIILYFT